VGIKLAVAPTALSANHLISAILAAPKLSESICPLCAVASGRVHSHYTRTLADLRHRQLATAATMPAKPP